MIKRLDLELWLIHHFRVLPTDERFLALTHEQIEAIWIKHLRSLNVPTEWMLEDEHEDPTFDAYAAQNEDEVARVTPDELKDTEKWRNVP